MKNRIKKNLTTILLILLYTGLNAQTTLSTSGGDASGTGGTASYTIGQMVFTTNSSSNGSVAQGVQQPFEISVVTALDEVDEINLAVSAYPNPITDLLTLKINSATLINNSTLNYQLYDVNGKLLELKKIESAEINISTQNLTPATYYLKVLFKQNSSSSELKTFKIIKN
jgi:hypothetical protein